MDYQKFILVGNASSDAKIQKSKKGDVSFATFGVGVKSGKDRTTFFPVVVFGKLGEALSPYIVKGRQVLIEGRVEMNNIGRFNIVADQVVLGSLPQGSKPEVKPEQTK
jgi:single-stranded DNA-binding protein